MIQKVIKNGDNSRIEVLSDAGKVRVVIKNSFGFPEFEFDNEEDVRCFMSELQKEILRANGVADTPNNCPGIPPYHIYSERTLDKKDWSVFDDLCEVCQHSIRAWMYHPCDWWMVMRAGCENTKMSTYSDNNN